MELTVFTTHPRPILHSFDHLKNHLIKHETQIYAKIPILECAHLGLVRKTLTISNKWNLFTLIFKSLKEQKKSSEVT